MRDGRLRQQRYWRFQITDDPPPGGEKAWIDELRELLRSSVVSRLESDVPIGIFLSGGIDSSTIAALAAAELGRERISTFTIGFNEDSFDERGYASIMASQLGSAHHVEVCDVEFMRAQSPNILAKSGELLGDPSLIPTSLLAASAARHVKVALSGDGGDELFGGYDPFLALGKARLYHQLVPKPVHAALRGLAGLMPVATTNMSLDFKINRALRGLSFKPQLWNPVWLAPLEPDAIASAFDQRFDVAEIYSEAVALWDGAPGLSDIDHTLEFYSNIYLPDNILMKSDRAGMMHGLEIRAPFLSLEIADFASRLPAHTKVRNGTTKWILKEAVRSLLPPEIIDRPKKGFGLPVAQWLRAAPWPGLQPIAGLNDQIFNTWANEHRAGQRDHRGALWCRQLLQHFRAGADREV